MSQKLLTLTRTIVLATLTLVCASCADVAHEGTLIHAEKIELDLTELDSEGLWGPPEGKVSRSYEFRIPDTARCRAEVKAIDPSIQFMPGSPGRIAAGDGQCLCIGMTGKDFREVLGRLAGLPYVDRIIACDFE